MATVEHSFLCRDTELCMKVAKMSREDIPQLHAINLGDVILESLSLVALLMCTFEKWGGSRTGGPVLGLFLVADIALEGVAISYATSIQPTIDLILSSGCLDVNQADGLGTRDILSNIRSDLSFVVSLGVAEVIVAVIATAGDVTDQYHTWRSRAEYAEKMTQTNRIFMLLLPAFTDVVLAYFDYFLFTTSANEDAKLLRRSILNNIGLPNTWCVGLADGCAPIIREDADRFGGQQPGEPDYTVMLVVCSVCIGLLLAVYLGIVTLYLECFTHLCDRFFGSLHDAYVDRKQRELDEAKRRRDESKNSKQDSDKSIAAVSSTSPAYDPRLDSFDQDDILAKAEQIQLERIQVQRTTQSSA